ETAKTVSKKNNIKIIYKPFFYGTDPLAILNEIPKVNAWHPDIILGPHYSNQFLLLRNYFKDILVLSSYASDKAINDLPSNFHSISPSDDTTVKAMSDFIKKKFTNNNILIINRIDCKDCNDISTLFKKMYNASNSNIQIKQNNFLGESDKLTNVEKLLTGYQKNDLIVILAVNLYNYTDLILKITTTLKNKNPTFISLVDNWGTPETGLSISNKMKLPFRAYLINPLLFNLKSKTFRKFNQTYFDLYGTYPNENVSYTTFRTLMSAVKAIKNCNIHNKNHDMRIKINECYQNNLRNNPNWFRPNVYGAYLLNANSGKLIIQMNMKANLTE
ncbi:MAG: hypothetical protein JO149_09150, partial [Gammaproteobacteria bacterium]|nr:hypothetical protein [Gammaproteobacteria bacterium]